MKPPTPRMLLLLDKAARGCATKPVARTRRRRVRLKNSGLNRLIRWRGDASFSYSPLWDCTADDARQCRALSQVHHEAPMLVALAQKPSEASARVSSCRQWNHLRASGLRVHHASTAVSVHYDSCLAELQK